LSEGKINDHILNDFMALLVGAETDFTKTTLSFKKADKPKLGVWKDSSAYA